MLEILETKTENIPFSETVKIVQEHLRADPELYFGYQSNIAMAFYNKCLEEKPHLNKEEVLEISNIAAKAFLDLFIKE